MQPFRELFASARAVSVRSTAADIGYEHISFVTFAVCARPLHHGNTHLDLQRAESPENQPAPDTTQTETAGHQGPKGTIHLRLLATSDLHVHILPYDYYTDHGNDRVGLARTATLMQQARAEAANCLLFDNGDFLQGSPLGDYIAQQGVLRPGDVHPILAAMNHLGYDAATLGNHEFSHGLDFLTSALEGAAFPVVSANVLQANGPHQNMPLVHPYVMLDRTLTDQHGKTHRVKIGVIGFTPPQIMIWDQHNLAGKITTRDVILMAKTYLPQMRQVGADLIIALSHSGIGAADAEDDMENASTALAALAGIDAVITGHSHLVFPSDDFTSTEQIDSVAGTLCGKPAVMPGFNGSHLGVIDLYLSPHGTGFKVLAHRSEARPIWGRADSGATLALVASHPDVVDVVASAHQETLVWTNRHVGDTPVPLHSYFALIGQSAAIDLVAKAQTHHVAAALADTPFAHLPVLASVAPFKAGGRGGPDNYTDVPAGEVLLRHAADLYIHPNTSAAIRMTGAEIADWLEYAAGIYHQIQPGSLDSALINKDFPSFSFDMICGLGFQIDLSQPARFDQRGTLINSDHQRIRSLTFEGKALDPAASFAIATNSYRIAANPGFLQPDDNRILYQSDISNRDVLLRYLALPNASADLTSVDWRFASMPHTTVTFETSPDAVAHLQQQTNNRLEPLGLTPAGFLRFRLHL